MKISRTHQHTPFPSHMFHTATGLTSTGIPFQSRATHPVELKNYTFTSSSAWGLDCLPRPRRLRMRYVPCCFKSSLHTQQLQKIPLAHCFMHDPPSKKIPRTADIFVDPFSESAKTSSGVAPPKVTERPALGANFLPCGVSEVGERGTNAPRAERETGLGSKKRSSPFFGCCPRPSFSFAP